MLIFSPKGIGAILSVAVAALTQPCAAQEQAKTTVTFLTAERPDTFAPAIAQFERQHKNIHIEYQQVPFDNLSAQVAARIGSGDKDLDLYAVDVPRVTELASKSYLAPLEDERAKLENIAGDKAIQAVSYQGKIYAYPLWTSTQIMYFNRDLLNAAHIPFPSADPARRLTWQQLVGQAQQAQQAGAPWGFSFEQVDRYYQLLSLYISYGAGSGLKGNDALTADLTSGGWQQVSDWYRSLYIKHIAPRGVTPEQTPDLFGDGKVAFFVGGPWNIGRFNKVASLHYGVAPMPYFAGGSPSTPTDSWAVGINPHSAHAREAKLFAEFISIDPEGSYSTVINNPLPPVNNVAFKRYIGNLSTMDSKIGPISSIVSYELAHTAVSRPCTKGYVIFETIIDRAFSDIRNGADSKQTLERAQLRLNRSFARIK
ncbi:extracellular solute-binding protein [Sodalis ligni]|uniref:sugar ABC transporter substrate-binding protein n=1 Tax=Sodalis ligni TaxID=2697027 RepID=UPI00193FD4D4|nr:extracellular solute-binding protein [Sodalis ligni]QWA10457.1 extracellular solute-binding protein [Sodalis ligni]